MEYVKVVALFLFIIFLVLQKWFGQKAKIIAYFFFIISSTLYIMNFAWSLMSQIITVAIVVIIVISSLYFEVKGKKSLEEKEDKSNQKTFADKNRRK